MSNGLGVLLGCSSFIQKGVGYLVQEFSFADLMDSWVTPHGTS